jgi:CBS domain-containing protein
MSAPVLEKAHLSLHAETAADLMTPNPVSIQADASIREAILLMSERRIGAAPVIDRAGRPVGVVSHSDILAHDRETVTFARRLPDFYTPHELAVAAGEELPEGFQVEQVDTTRVRDIMTPAVFAVGPTTPAAQVVEQLLTLNVHRLFVVDRSGVLVGVISTMDILRHLKA